MIVVRLYLKICIMIKYKGMKTYENILKEKIDYYGRTEAAYQFAAEEFSNMNVTETIRLHNEKLKALEDLKQWCFETCQPLEEERLHEILERL